METMPPYTYKFVKNQGSDSENQQKKQNKKDKHGYLSKDVKVINDLIDDLSKLKTADHATTAAHAVTAAAAVATSTNTVAAATHAASGEMTNPLEIDNDKESLQSVSSSSSHRSTEPKAKLKEQVRHPCTFLFYKLLGLWVFISVSYSIVKDSNADLIVGNWNSKILP